MLSVLSQRSRIGLLEARNAASSKAMRHAGLLCRNLSSISGKVAEEVVEDGVGGAEAKPSTSTDCYLCYSCSWFCGLIGRVGKQNRGSVLGFVYLGTR